MAERRWFPAPAKINLALHVTGQRGDGYHQIETIAIFADCGERISIGASDSDAFRIEGPEAEGLAGDAPSDNLVIKARDLFRRIAAENEIETPPVEIVLDKHLPPGSGIGGGSADAAATLRGLMVHWNAHSLHGSILEQAVTLGADVPMCLNSKPLFASGVGEEIHPLAAMPALPLVLANPRAHVSTPTVFGALLRKGNAPIPFGGAEDLANGREWAEWLATKTRNDLQDPSLSLTPNIGGCLSALAESGALLARMSGSGATCFGIYNDAKAAREAAAELLQNHPDWWITTATTDPSPGA